MNKKVQLISFILACVVVFFHAGQGPDPMHTKVMAIAAQNVAVPFFFVISGYFFMKRYDGSFRWWRAQMRKRLKTLVVPYVIWCSAFSIVCHGLHFKGYLSDMGVWGVCPLLGALWYVKFLILVAVISPVLILSVDWLRSNRLEIPALICILLLFLLPMPLKTSVMQTIVWFSVGVWVARTGDKLQHFGRGGGFVQFAVFACFWGLMT